VDWDALPDPFPPGGIPVRVRATFGGTGIFRSKNNLNPALTLFEDHLELKVMTVLSFRYEELESADARTALLTKNISLRLPGSRGRPTANVRTKEDFQGVLRFLASKGVALTARARELVT
jgi:hypothetical protein